MPPHLPYLLLAISVGACVAVQSGVNAQLRLYLGHPALAALTNFIVGTLALVLFLLATRAPWPTLAAVGRAPAWTWIGGLLGAFYVASAVVIAPKLGAASMFALVIAGQVVMSLLLDQFGWIGFPEHPINIWRIVGALFLVVGVVLVVRN